ncbi:hypothetical protein K438DRAFT_757371 [Mycena galopus ATCC 62051]|nr:hypothetical protein K438DRAFT_757371 [Mycena galopus ATCC 62051]
MPGRLKTRPLPVRSPGTVGEHNEGHCVPERRTSMSAGGTSKCESFHDSVRLMSARSPNGGSIVRNPKLVLASRARFRLSHMLKAPKRSPSPAARLNDGYAAGSGPPSVLLFCNVSTGAACVCAHHFHVDFVMSWGAHIVSGYSSHSPPASRSRKTYLYDRASADICCSTAGFPSKTYDGNPTLGYGPRVQARHSCLLLPLHPRCSLRS